MKFTLPTFLGPKEKKDYFVALLLRDETISVVLFEESQNKIHIIGRHTEHLKTSLEEASFDEWLEVVDAALSTAESALPNKVTLQKTVFGVKESWVENTRIKKEYLGKLKRLSEALGLQPIGFLIFAEAIAHLLQQDEGAPVSALLIETGKKTLSITLLRAGRIVETHTAESGDHVVTTVDELLKQFTNAEILPSRIILFETDNDEGVVQSFIGHTWSKSLPFLHVPQTSILSSGFDVRAVLYGTATQLGFDVSKSHSIPTTHVTVPSNTTNAYVSRKVHTIHEEEQQEDKEEEAIVGETNKISSHDSSFVDSSLLGFVKGHDIAQTPPPSIHTPLAIHHHSDIPAVTDSSEQTFHVPDEPPPLQHERPLHQHRSFFASMHKTLQTLLAMRYAVMQKLKRKNSMPHHTSSKKMLLIPLSLLLLLGLFGLYIFELHATVTLALTPKIFSQEQAVTLKSGSDNDFSHHIIAVKTLTVTEEGSVDTKATGTKEVGEKAKGTVTIYNIDDAPKTLQSGTTLTSDTGLTFALNQDATVASASGDTFSGIKPGTTNAAVTATAIGIEYNLPSNRTFKIGTGTSVAAKNSDPFSGGSKKQITVIAKDDSTKLATELENSLANKAKEDMAKKLSSDQTALPLFTTTELTKKTLSKNVGEEAKTLTLSGTVSYQTMIYDKPTIVSYINTLLQSKLSNDLTLAENGIQYDVKDIKVKSDTDTSLTLVIHATFLPKLDEKKMSQDIAGKSFDQATAVFASFPQIATTTIFLRPNIPFLPRLLPRIADHITIVTKINE